MRLLYTKPLLKNMSQGSRIAFASKILKIEQITESVLKPYTISRKNCIIIMR